jgi:hypothetical protein
MHPTKTSLLLAILAVIPATSHAQRPREVHPRSCARSDSIVSANNDILKRRVRVAYQSGTDSTWLDAGSNSPAIATARMRGRGPMAAPVAQLTIMLHGSEAEIVRRGELPPVVMLVTDDSVSRELSPIQFGTFVAIGPHAPPPQIVRIPLSAELDAADFAAIARSRRVALHVGAVNVRIPDGDRRDITALFVVLVCGIE